MDDASGMTLTARDGQRFRFDAGTLCLEFLLTGAADPWEQLHAPEDLAAWIPRSRLGLPGPVSVDESDLRAAKRLRAAVLHLAEHATGRRVPGARPFPEPPLDGSSPGESSVGESPPGGSSVGRSPVGGSSPGGAPRDGQAGVVRALEAVNEAAAAPPPVPVVSRAPGRDAGSGLERGWAEPVTAAQFLSAVARDAIELFSSPLVDRVRMCEGERCALIFLDTSRPGARRWCSMSRCGNRHKMRARRS
ncbi:CGNR zinc finger domain-containing protein [Nonomuraea sp. NPDC047897]|uniref:CGNR zinc finger domain-containing protein n=1 Tax=Nonomuraea sp. NPDC047897 TaxID=3364346 RepID=UPI00371A789A